MSCGSYLWAHTPSGMFTASSAYKLLVSYESVSNAGTSNLDIQKKICKSIWQLRVPHKIKHFAWRTSNNALPTMVNLHRRQIVQNVSCNMCKDQPEDVLHAVWFCKENRGIWDSLDWFHQLVLSPLVCFSDLLSRFLHSRDEFQAKIFIIAAWMIWNRRNALHFGRPALLMPSICSIVGSYLQEFLQAQTKEPAPPRAPIVQ